MDVRVLEAGLHDSAREVDYLGPRGGVRVEVVVRDDGDDAPVRHGEPVAGEVGAAVEDVAVAEDEGGDAHRAILPSESVETPAEITRVGRETRPTATESLACARLARHHGSTHLRRRSTHDDPVFPAVRRRGLRRSAEVGARAPVDALHPDVELRPRGRADHREGRGRVHLGREGPQVPRRARRPVRQPGRPRPHRAGRGGRQAGLRARVLPALVLRPPLRHRAGRADRELRARRPQPGLLHQRRRRGRRDRVEAREELLQAHRQTDEAQGDQPRGGLPRHHPGRPVDHGAAGPQAAVRAAGALDVPGAEHELLPGPRAVPGRHRPGPRGLRPLGRRRDRGRHRERGSRQRRGGLPRAGAERGRLLPAAARLLPAGPRDLRRVRRPAGQRRGDLRVRAAGPHVRAPSATATSPT